MTAYDLTYKIKHQCQYFDNIPIGTKDFFVILTEFQCIFLFAYAYNTH